MTPDVDPVRFAAARDLVNVVDRIEALEADIADLRYQVFQDWCVLSVNQQEFSVIRSMFRRPVPPATPVDEVEEEPTVAPHPPQDCPDCGGQHVAWSELRGQRQRLEELERQVVALARRVDPVLADPYDEDDVSMIVNEIGNPLAFCMDVRDQRLRVRAMAAVGDASLEARREYARRRAVA
jgi:hypothetical protein